MKTILDGIFTIPLVLPPTVAGFFLSVCVWGETAGWSVFPGVFQRKDRIFLGSYGAGGGGHVIPLMYRSARGAFEQVDDTLVQAARTLGMENGPFSGRCCWPMRCREWSAAARWHSQEGLASLALRL